MIMVLGPGAVVEDSERLTGDDVLPVTAKRLSLVTAVLMSEPWWS